MENTEYANQPSDTFCRHQSLQIVSGDMPDLPQDSPRLDRHDMCQKVQLHRARDLFVATQCPCRHHGKPRRKDCKLKSPKPRYLTTNLDDFGVCKYFIEYLQILSPRFQSIYNPVFISRADLHQRNKTNI